MRVALERTVQLFVGKHKEVWLLLQIPELEFHLEAGAEFFRQRGLQFVAEIVQQGLLVFRQA